MQPLNFIAGLVLLIAGRPLYWAFVGIAGFLFGARVAAAYLVNAPQSTQLIAAVAAGIVGALLAMIAQRFAFALAGLFAGGYLAGLAAEALAASGSVQLGLVIAGALVGAILAVMVMDWAIVILSSLMGAGLICEALALAPTWSAAAFVGLAVLGAVIQGKSLARRAPAPAHGDRAR